MRVVSSSFVWSAAAFSFAGGAMWAQMDPGRPACSMRASLAQGAETIVFGHVSTSEGLPALGAEIVGSAGGRASSAADGSFELAFVLPDDAQSIELTALLERDGGRSAVRSRVVLAQPLGPNDAGILTLGPAEDCRPGWLPTFGGTPGTDQAILALETFDDGSGPELFAGGFFTSAGGAPSSYIARWDGQRWSSPGSGANAGVFALHAFDDGNGPALYAGGEFTNLGGTANRVARWDGQHWSPLGIGVNNAVHALEEYDDGNGPALYAAGDFTSGSGVPMTRIGQWNGTSWSPLGSGLSATVYALEVFDDGSGPALYAGGNFTSAGGAFANHVARWNGASWSALGGGIDSPVWALATFDDGTGPALYAGGPFTSAGGAPAGFIARWNGTSWTSVGGGVGSSVDALHVHDDGTGPALIAAGRFLSAGGQAASRVARWDGSGWAALGSGVAGGIGTTSGLASLDDGNGPALFVAGTFTSAGGLAVSNVGRWNGSSWSSLGMGLTGAVLATAVYDDPSTSRPGLYAGGFFSVGGTTARGIARWNGAQWSPLPGSPSSGFAPLAMTVFDDGTGPGPTLSVGGSFTASSGGPGNYIARWDGASWAPLGSGMSSLVRALAVFDDGAGPALIAGGDFTVAGGQNALHLARWNGSQWSSFGSLSFGGATAHALVVFDDGTGPALYVGGTFTRAGPIPASNIARWDGVLWSALGSGTDTTVEALAVFDDGSGQGPALIAAGRFQQAGGAAANHIARWDGTSWSPLAGGLDNPVHALTVFDDLGPDRPALYAGGSFRSASGVAANRIARWDGSEWSPLGRGLNDSVQSLCVFDDPLRSAPTLIAGGFFTRATDSLDSFLAAWQGWSCADTLAPTLDCPDPIVVTDLGAPGEVVVFTVTASDDLDPAPTVVCLPPAGSVFPPGLTLVTCKATDATGNEATCEFQVRVQGIPRQRR